MGNEASAHGYDHPYYDGHHPYYDDWDAAAGCGGGGGDGGVNRRGWAQVSQAALARGQKAEAMFGTIKADWESRTDLEPGTEYHIPLLDPSHHLVGKVWKDFRNHVQNSNGNKHAYGGGYWNVTRRVATAEEKVEYKVKRKSKAYFVEATFYVPRAAAGVPNTTTMTKTTNKPTTATSKTNKKKRGGASVAPMPKSSTNNAAVAGGADHPTTLSKKPRLLANLTNNNNNNASVAAATKKKKNTSSTAAAAAYTPPPTMYAMPQHYAQAQQQHHHSFKYGDIVGLLVISPNNNPSSYTHVYNKLAMVIGLVDSHTLLVVHPNQVQETVPIHGVQLVKPMEIMMPMPTTTTGMPTTTAAMPSMPMQQQQLHPVVAPPMSLAATSGEGGGSQKADLSTAAAAVETSATSAAATGEENQQQQIGVGN